MLKRWRASRLSTLGHRPWQTSFAGSFRYLSTNNLFQISEEVTDALATGKPVVALETTIYTHGFPYPENVALSSHLESLVRVKGAVPATIGVLDGIARVGMEADHLLKLVSTTGSPNTWKLSRRDLGFVTGLGLRGKKFNGGTTIAGTMILAHLAGIKIFATGGLGGVHRGGENSMDISADLTELGRTMVAVVSSGCKSFLDIPRTLEYLETQGVGVGTFADGRTGNVDFPAFYSRDSGVRSPMVIEDEADAAAIVYAQAKLVVQSGLLFANPVPEQDAMAKADIDKVIAQAVQEANGNGISGSANTPYILKRIKELSGGASVKANKALISANVIRGTKVAVELAKLERRQEVVEKGNGVFIATPQLLHSQIVPVASSEFPATTTNVSVLEEESRQADVLVIGSLAADTICDYAPFRTKQDGQSPPLHTSNPAVISQSPGGVGRNVATAAQLAGASVHLASAVSDDLAGQSLLHALSQSGLSTHHIRQLSTKDNARTAQYVAFNNTKKDLVMAMADMSIFIRPEFEESGYWTELIRNNRPKWSVVDANWSPPILSAIFSAAQAAGTPVAFEPVSNAKAARLFSNAEVISPKSVVPNNVIRLATPNVHELKAMYEAATDARLFEGQHWWEIIDAFGMSGARNQLEFVVGKELVDRGVPQQCIQLLPFIPNLVVKLGAKGSLRTSILRKGETLLTHPDSARYILSRSSNEGLSPVGGVYMELHPPAEVVDDANVVSVNGVGDTMLGVIMAVLAQGMDLRQAINIAQQAAVLTLKSKEAVSAEVANLRPALRSS